MGWGEMGWGGLRCQKLEERISNEKLGSLISLLAEHTYFPAWEQRKQTQGV